MQTYTKDALIGLIPPHGMLRSVEIEREDVHVTDLHDPFVQSVAPRDDVSSRLNHLMHFGLLEGVVDSSKELVHAESEALKHRLIVS